MTKRNLVSVTCITFLIVSLGGLSGPIRRVLADVSCANTSVLSIGASASRATTGETICFRISVPARTQVLTLALKAVSGNFDLYVARGSTISTLRDGPHKFSLSTITPSDPPSPYVLKSPQAGDYIIGIAPRSAGNISFNLKTSGPTVKITRPAVTSCTGDICSTSHPLTASYDVTVGAEFGAKAILPIEVQCPGLISARATWSGSAQNLALILNGPGQVGYFDRRDGVSPLTVGYTATAANTRQGSRWWVSLVNFSGGTADSNITIDYPDPDSCVVNDSISNFRVTNATDTEITFNVDYTYSGGHGENIGLGVYALQNGQKQPWFGYRPSSVYQGSGTATVTLVLLTDRNDLPSDFSTDQVQFDMYVGGASEFLTQRYDYVKRWQTAPAIVPTEPPALGLRDEILASIGSSSVPNPYPQEAERFVDALLALLGEVPSQTDTGDRINGVVGRIWSGWMSRANEHGFDPEWAEPGNYGFSPFRQLVIRMIQWQQDELDDAQISALYSFLTRDEDASAWRENVDGVIGAINREYFQ